MVRLCGLAQLGGLLVHWKKHCKWLKETAAVSHNHPEGIQSAQAVAAAIYLARTGKSKQANPGIH